MPSIKPGCSFPSLYYDFSLMLENFGLDQIEDEPTRCGNILDHFLTLNHTLVQTIQFVPGIADHDIMVADVNVKPQITKQKPKCYLLWILFVIRVCFCYAVLSVPFKFSPLITCWERADLFALLSVVFLVFCHFPIRCPGSGVVLDCIDS